MLQRDPRPATGGGLIPARFGDTSFDPFVATLVDVTGLVIYFTVGIVVLHGTVL